MKEVQRPIFLNLWRITFPITAIISILHRISGVIIFLFLPVGFCVLGRSLQSSDAFLQITNGLKHQLGWLFLLWVLSVAVFGHLFAGIRHLLMDAGAGESLTAGRTSAWIVLIATIVVAILLGIWIWP